MKKQTKNDILAFVIGFLFIVTLTFILPILFGL
jgi:hypothetical protein